MPTQAERFAVAAGCADLFEQGMDFDACLVRFLRAKGTPAPMH